MTKFDHKKFLKTVPSLPGIYKMFDQKGSLLYVGKAKNLKKRVTSYFAAVTVAKVTVTKVSSLVAKIATIETMVTSNEVEALLLEQTFIKTLKPPYNILLRDDKSYPYIFMSTSHAYPRLAFHRGKQRVAGLLLGPYPNGSAVRASLSLLQKIFKVRQCDDSYFNNRNRPCLQYQINRCTAPCMKYISPDEYAKDVNHTKLFLEGKSQKVIIQLTQEMERASEQLQFENAARYRDQVKALRKLQVTQCVTTEANKNADIIAVAITANKICIQVLWVRDGRVLGNRVFFPRWHGENEVVVILEAFIPQYYLNMQQQNMPQLIVVAQEMENKSVLEASLTQVLSQKIRVITSKRAPFKEWQYLAQMNAEQALQSRLNRNIQIQLGAQQLQQILVQSKVYNRMECFDVSHTQGTATRASCVVFDRNGPLKRLYRTYSISNITPGDDYGALSQVLRRHYTRLLKEHKELPEIVIVDGGRGQLKVAQSILLELGLSHMITLAVAKGEGRKAGLETVWRVASNLLDCRNKDYDFVPLDFSAYEDAFKLIQQIRDEAHRFALSGHRKQRQKLQQNSDLEKISGLGPKRIKSLLIYFGGGREITEASVTDLVKVPGIGKKMAQHIYSVINS